jgi:hypothetical protein
VSRGTCGSGAERRHALGEACPEPLAVEQVGAVELADELDDLLLGDCHTGPQGEDGANGGGRTLAVEQAGQEQAGLADQHLAPAGILSIVDADQCLPVGIDAREVYGGAEPGARGGEVEDGHVSADSEGNRSCPRTKAIRSAARCQT